jgi:hypothetical protein
LSKVWTTAAILASDASLRSFAQGGAGSDEVAQVVAAGIDPVSIAPVISITLIVSSEVRLIAKRHHEYVSRPSISAAPEDAQSQD